MPNRLIREGLIDSQRLLEQPFEARWLFVVILLSADDAGLFEAKAFHLARRADLRREAVSVLLQSLVDADLVRLYDVGDSHFGFIPRFRQRLQIKRLRYPPPPTALVQDDEDALGKLRGLANHRANGCAADGQRLDNGCAADGQPPEPNQNENLTQKREEPPLPPAERRPHATDAGQVCRVLREAGISRVNPGNPLLAALLEAGATTDEFLSAASKAAGKSSPFAYVLAIVKREREDAEKARHWLFQGPLAAQSGTFAARLVETAAHLTTVARPAEPQQGAIDVESRIIG